MKKKNKLKWENVAKLLMLIISLIVVLHDSYLIIFKSYQWTWLGVATFMIFTYVFVSIVYDFYEQIKSMPEAYKPKHTCK